MIENDYLKPSLSPDYFLANCYENRADTSDGKDKAIPLWDAMLENKHIKRPNEIRSFLLFDKPLPLHPGVAAYFGKNLEAPFSISYQSYRCNRKTGLCYWMFDIPEIYLGDVETLADIGLPLLPQLTEWLENPNKFVRCKAAYVLGAMWPQNPEKATVALLEALDKETDDDAKEYMIRALGKIEQVKPETIKKLNKIIRKEPFERPDFSDGSHGMGGNITSIRRQPITTIAAIVSAKINPDAVLSFQELLQSKSHNIQITAIRGLAEIIRLEQRRLNISEIRDVNSLSPASQAAIRLLQKALLLKNRKVKDEALFTLVGFGQVAANPDVVSGLTEKLLNTEKTCSIPAKQFCEYHIRRRAIMGLMSMPKAAGNTITMQRLANIVQGDDRIDRDYALRALAAIAKFHNIPEVIIKKLKAFTPPEGESKENYIRTLGEFASASSDSEQIISQLRLQLFDAKGDKYGRSAAVEALVKIMGKTPQESGEIIGVIIKSIKEEQDETVRKYKIQELAKAGSLAAKAVPMLIAYLKYKDEGVSEEAALALGEIGFRSAEVKAALENTVETAMSKHGKHQLIYNACNSLIKLYGDDSGLIPLFSNLLHTEEYSYKLNGIECLEKLGPKAKDTIADLKSFTTDSNSQLQNAAIKTLQAIGTIEALEIVKYAKSSVKPEIMDWENYLNELYNVQKIHSDLEVHCLHVNGG